MEEKAGQEIIRQLREIREVMLAHSKAFRSQTAVLRQMIAKLDAGQKAVAAIRSQSRERAK